jgi:3-dehydroquinate synthase
MKLNLGHTIGHGIEAQSNFTISHGKAVAAGMAIAARASSAWGICSSDTASRIVDVLKRFGLPVTSCFSAESLYISSLSDKKRSGGQVNLILPRAIGVCVIHPISVDQIQSFIEAGL